MNKKILFHIIFIKCLFLTRSQNVFDMTVRYDAAGRASHIETRLGLNNNMSSYEYEYDPVGSLVRVSQDDRPRWRYVYDADQKLTRIENGRVGSALRYDREGR